MNRLKVVNKYSEEIDIVFVNHIATIYTERDDIIIRMDNGHRIYTTFKSLDEALNAIDTVIGATV